MSSHTQSQESLAVLGWLNEKDAASGVAEKLKCSREHGVISAEADGISRSKWPVVLYVAESSGGISIEKQPTNLEIWIS